MNEIYTWVSLGTAIVTALAAIISLILTGRQTRISNKQHLFDRRISSWEICKGLYELYARCQDALSEHLLDSYGETIPTYRLEYFYLTDNMFLNELQEAVIDWSSQEAQTKLPIKFEKLRKVSTEFPLIFDGECAQAFSDFVLTYQKLLYRIYICMAFQQNTREYYVGIHESDYHEQMMRELREYRGYKMVNDAISEMNGIMTEIQANNNAYISNIEKQIKLTNRLRIQFFIQHLQLRHLP